MDTRKHQVAEAAHVLLRIGAGLFFMMHGGQKLFGWFGGMGGQGGTAEVGSLMWVAGILEVVGGTLMILGLFARPVAFILAGEMVVAYFMSHLPRGLFPLENNGEPAALYALIWLYFAASGAGQLSLDALRGREGEVVATEPEREEAMATWPQVERRRRAG
ncbi:MAG TPA: DoxX family protein [Gemmatimonadaceae bacterium]|nr:DoxX family protein [Gemmatimonadaceae bacterium]